MSVRSRSRPSALFDPPRQHLCSAKIPAASHPRRSGEQATKTTRKGRANGCFLNGWHGRDGASTRPPPVWSRPLLRAPARMRPYRGPAQAEGEQTQFAGAVHQPIRRGTLCMTSPVESKVIGAFLLAAKEEPKREIRSGGGCGSASCAPTALRARSAQALGGTCSGAAAGVRVAMAHQTLTALRPSLHGGSGPAVATRGDVG